MAERERILEVGFEGGLLSIFRTRMPDGSWRFVAFSDETTLADLLDEDDQEGLSFSGELGAADTFAAALQLIRGSPWHRLSPQYLHEEYAAVVIAEVLRLGGRKEMNRWKSALSRRSGRL